MKVKYKKIPFVRLMILLWVVGLFAQPPDTLWTKAFTREWDDYGFSVQQTSDSGYIIVGQSVTFNDLLSYDIWLIKTDPDGDTLWTRVYGGERHDAGNSVQQTMDGGYIIAGITESFGAGAIDFYLIKTDEDGDTLWTRTYGGASTDLCKSIQQTSDSGYIMVGYSKSFGTGKFDIYLIKTKQNGDINWEKTYGGIDHDKALEGQQTTDGGYIFVGRTESFSGSESSDVYLLKTNEEGDTIWTRTYGGDHDDCGLSVQQTADGGYIIAGSTASYGRGRNDVYLIKTDENGDTLWTKTYGGVYDDEGYSVRQTSDNGYIVGGRTASFGRGGSDFYFIKTDAYGDSIWTKTCGTIYQDHGYQVQQTADGGYIMVGFNNYLSGGIEDPDIYLVKLAQYPGIEDKGTSYKSFLISRIESNPFQDKTLIQYELPNNTNVNITIYNLLGKKIKILLAEKQDAGRHSVIWNGIDDLGKSVSSGIYFLRFEAGELSTTKRLIKIED
ncbi:MAG: T9SS type A sorting domain-containing protein [bacterium]